MLTGEATAETARRFLKNTKLELLYDPAVPLLDIYPQIWKHQFKKTSFPMFKAALFMFFLYLNLFYFSSPLNFLFCIGV